MMTYCLVPAGPGVHCSGGLTLRPSAVNSLGMGWPLVKAGLVTVSYVLVWVSETARWPVWEQPASTTAVTKRRAERMRRSYELSQLLSAPESSSNE